jgi:hypothetical protein
VSGVQVPFLALFQRLHPVESKINSPIFARFEGKVERFSRSDKGLPLVWTRFGLDNCLAIF